MRLIEKEQLLMNSSKFCVSAYEEYYDELPLHPGLVKQYQVDDDNL